MAKTTKYEQLIRKKLQETKSMAAAYLPRQSGKSLFTKQSPIDVEPPSDKFITVYRMEIFDELHGERVGRGIWNASIYFPELEPLTWKYKRELRGPICEPEEEGIPFSHGMFCAILEDDDHMCAWLPWLDTWEALYTRGMRLNEYQVPDNKLYVGKTQVCYWPEYAQFVREVDFAEFRKRPYEKRRKEQIVVKELGGVPVYVE